MRKSVSTRSNNCAASRPRHKKTGLPARPRTFRVLVLLVGVCCTFLTDFRKAQGEQDASAVEQLEAMSAEDREQLRRKLERFEILRPEEQQRLRELESRIAADPNSEELRQVMSRYYEWLKTLSPKERTELGELSPADRLKRIEEIRKAQKLIAETKGADALAGNDWPTVWRWLGDVAWRQRKSIIAAAPPDRRPMLKDGPKEDRHVRMTISREMFMQAGEANKPLPINEADFAELESDLSPPAREALAATTTLDAKLQLLRAWLERGRRSGQSDGRERIQKFFEQLPEEEKQKLLAIPDEHQRRARMFEMYWESQNKGGHKGPSGPGRHGRSDGPRRRGGPGRGDRRDFESPDRDESGRSKRNESPKTNDEPAKEPSAQD